MQSQPASVCTQTRIGVNPNLPSTTFQLRYMQCNLFSMNFFLIVIHQMTGLNNNFEGSYANICFHDINSSNLQYKIFAKAYVLSIWF